MTTTTRTAPAAWDLRLLPDAIANGMELNNIPTYRQLARTAGISHVSLHKALAPESKVTENVVGKLAGALGASPNVISRWVKR